jgi:hypothetical protein
VPDPAYPTTPDGRYFVVRGRLWRCTNPALDEATRAPLVSELMAARYAVGRAMRSGDVEAEKIAATSSIAPRSHWESAGHPGGPMARPISIAASPATRRIATGSKD